MHNHNISRKIKIFQEKINIQWKSFKFFNDKLNNQIQVLNPQEAIWIIDRNLQDNTFSIKHKPSFTTNQANIFQTSYLKINNKREYKNQDELIFNQEPGQNRWIHYKSQNLSKIPFDKIERILLGSNYTNHKYDRFFYTQKLQSIPREIDINFKEIICLKFIKKITIKPKKNFVARSRELLFMKEHFDLKISYFNLYIVPENLSFKHNTQSIMQIYIDKNNIEFPNQDWKIYGDFTSSAHDKKMTFNLKKSHNNNFVKQKNWKKIGQIASNDYTYYDYEKEIVKIGYSKNSQKRDMVPFNFHGKYFRWMNLNFNNFLKDLQVNVEYEVPKPLLNQESGIIKLTISETKDVPINKKGFLTSYNIKLIKKQYFEISEIKSMMKKNQTIY